MTNGHLDFSPFSAVANQFGGAVSRAPMLDPGQKVSVSEWPCQSGADPAASRSRRSHGSPLKTITYRPHRLGRGQGFTASDGRWREASCARVPSASVPLWMDEGAVWTKRCRLSVSCSIAAGEYPRQVRTSMFLRRPADDKAARRPPCRLEVRRPLVLPSGSGMRGQGLPKGSTGPPRRRP